MDKLKLIAFYGLLYKFTFHNGQSLSTNTNRTCTCKAKNKDGDIREDARDLTDSTVKKGTVHRMPAVSLNNPHCYVGC